jgi:hypothetical protein
MGARELRFKFGDKQRDRKEGRRSQSKKWQNLNAA